MRDYATLENYLGDVPERTKEIAKKLYDLAMSVPAEPENRDVFLNIFREIAHLVNESYLMGKPAETVRVEFELSAGSPLDKERISQFAYTVVDIMHSVQQDVYECYVMDHGKTSLSRMEKMLGAWVLGLGGDLAGYTSTNEPMKRRYAASDN